MKFYTQRFISLLVVLSLMFVYAPVSAEEIKETTVKENPYAYASACYASDEIFCTFDIDVNSMHLYEDSVIQLSFDIFGIGNERYTPVLTSSVAVAHNITDTTVYTAENNNVVICITVTEETSVQGLDDYEIEHIVIDLVNTSGELIYSIEISLLNTQYGVFVSYINDECLIDSFAKWLCENGYISIECYNAVIEEKLTATPLSLSTGGIKTYATTGGYSPYSMYVDYNIVASNSGSTLTLELEVYWIDTNGNQQPARNVNIYILDEDTSSNYELAYGSTDNNGCYNASFSNQTGTSENGGVDIRVKIEAKSRYAYVTASSDPYYFLVDCGDNIASSKHGVCTYGSSSSNISKAFCILDALQTGGRYVYYMSGTHLDAVTVKYPYSGLLVSHYNKLNQTIHLENNTYSSWDTIIHEYGHYVADEFGIYPFTAVAHSMEENCISYIVTNGLWNAGSNLLSGIKYDGCALAWQEGWATYFSISAQVQQNTKSMGIYRVGDVSYKAYHIEFEKIYKPSDQNADEDGNIPLEGMGEAGELAVARVLWDMTDTSSTYGSEDYDAVNWGFHLTWNVVMASEAKTFSEFMSYVYSLGGSIANARYVGLLLEKQKISANLMYPSITSTKATITWSPAYEDACVGNDYYLDVYNSSKARVYSVKITPSSGTSTTSTISGTTWSNLCANNPGGMYICIRTVPYNTAIGYDDVYYTGPYYSEIVTYTPTV